MSKFEHFCWIWQFKNNQIIDRFEGYDYYYRVKMEDLTDKKDGVKNLKKLFKFLDLPEVDLNLNKLSKDKINLPLLKQPSPM